MRVRRPHPVVRGPFSGLKSSPTPLPLSPPFQACLPFNLAIAATPAPPARLELTAEPAVLDAITASVAGTTLSLAASSFATGAPITAVLRVPADAATNTNRAVRARQLWGTDAYTHDSDVVAVLMHQG